MVGLGEDEKVGRSGLRKQRDVCIVTSKEDSFLSSLTSEKLMRSYRDENQGYSCS